MYGKSSSYPKTDRVSRSKKWLSSQQDVLKCRWCSSAEQLWEGYESHEKFMGDEPKPRWEYKKPEGKKVYSKGFVVLDIPFGREEKATDKENFDTIRWNQWDVEFTQELCNCEGRNDAVWWQIWDAG